MLYERMLPIFIYLFILINSTYSAQLHSTQFLVFSIMW